MRRDNMYVSIPCDLFKGNSLILGVGSPLRSDDRAGLVLCDSLNQSGVHCVKCEYGLENCIDVILEKKPEKLIVIDTAFFNRGQPGDIILLDDTRALANTLLLTTHNIPPRLLINTIRELTPLREVYIIGIYPANLDIGVDISSQVSRAINTLVEDIVKCFKNI